VNALWRVAGCRFSVEARVSSPFTPWELNGQMEKLDKIDDRVARKAKTSELNIDYFAGFIKELRKTTPAAGCHIMAVGFEEIVREIIEASGLKA
jgi:5,10-methylenetetrahydrofolate reductase